MKYHLGFGQCLTTASLLAASLALAFFFMASIPLLPKMGERGNAWAVRWTARPHRRPRTGIRI